MELINKENTKVIEVKNEFTNISPFVILTIVDGFKLSELIEVLKNGECTLINKNKCKKICIDEFSYTILKDFKHLWELNIKYYDKEKGSE